MMPTGSLAGVRRRVHRLLRPMAKSVERVAVERLGISPSTLERVKSVTLAPSGSPLVTVDTVDLAVVDPERIRGAGLDAPRRGSQERIHALHMAGWVLGTSSPVKTVQVRHQGRLVGSALLDRPRPEIAKRFSTIPHADRCGFRVHVGMVGLPLTFELSLWAVCEDKVRVRIATVRGRREPVQQVYQPALRPIMMTTLGRSGGTWLMRLLSEHPAIVVHREYPYELRTARYWFHLFKVLADPADHLRSASLTNFSRSSDVVGHNPFYPDALASSPDLIGWFGRDYVEDAAAFCQQSIDRFYQRVAVAQSQRDVLYFAEKFQENHEPSLAWELYPDAREIFLVRDFRDTATSKLAFVGIPKGAFDAADMVRRLDKRRVHRLIESWNDRSTHAHLVRYEELVRQPHETLTALLRYLDLDWTPPTVDGMIRRAAEETADLRRHRTTDSPEASIGRWRRDLSPELQAACETAFGEALATFGYGA